MKTVRPVTFWCPFCGWEVPTDELDGGWWDGKAAVVQMTCPKCLLSEVSTISQLLMEASDTRLGGTQEM